MAVSKKTSILPLSAAPLLMVLASQGLILGGLILGGLISGGLISGARAQATAPSQPGGPPPAQSTTQGPARPAAQAGPPVNTLKETFDRLIACFKPPSASQAMPMDITVMVSFNRKGEILGKPRITYESAAATDRDRLAYRVAVMEALQRCSPMPFTEAMAGAVAGRPLTLLLRTRLKPEDELQP